MKDEKDEKNDEDTYDVIPSSPDITFRFTPPHECDGFVYITNAHPMQFQSTPPRGGDCQTRPSDSI